MKKYKMIACDLDETLLKSDSSVTDENLNAISKLSEKGIEFVLATGRALPEIPKELDIPEVRFIVFSTGAAVLDKKTSQFKFFSMDCKKAKKVVDILSKYNVYFVWHQNGLFYGEPENIKQFEEYNVVPSVCKTLREVAAFEEKITSFENIESFCTFFKYEDEKLKCKEELCAIDGISVLETWPYCLEIMSVFAGKENAVKYVAETLGFSLEEVISVGDSGNDVALAKICGLPLAVSNACEKMKEVCSEVICSNNENVAQFILEKYFR